MEHLLFCVNHPEKIAKRHCNKCDQNICNECAFESHVEHHSELTKIEYSIDTKEGNFSQNLSEEIKLIIEKSLNDLKPKIYQLVLDKTEEYIKDSNNLHLKLNQTKEIKKEKIIPLRRVVTQKSEADDISKNQNNIKTNSSKISERIKQFNSNKRSELPKKIDENNPINKTKKLGGIKERSKMFESNY